MPRSFKRRGAFIRYISAGTVIWLLKPDIMPHYAQLGHFQFQAFEFKLFPTTVGIPIHQSH